MAVQVTAIMLGVEDLARSKRFYGDAWAARSTIPTFVSFNLGDRPSSLALYQREAAARGAGISPEGSGFRGVSFHFIVPSSNAVDEVMGKAVAAGGGVVKPAAPSPWGRLRVLQRPGRLPLEGRVSLLRGCRLPGDTTPLHEVAEVVVPLTATSACCGGETDMPRFMVLYVGPPTPPDASHEGWPAWFDRLGDRLVDKGSPLASGLALHGDGSTGGAPKLNGYSIIQADDSNQALGLLKDHPYLAQGRAYAIEVYLLP